VRSKATGDAVALAWYRAIMRGMQGQYYQYQHGFPDWESADTTLEDIAGGTYDRWEEFGLQSGIEIRFGPRGLHRAA
jgi:hypothetical protein